MSNRESLSSDDSLFNESPVSNYPQDMKTLRDELGSFSSYSLSNKDATSMPASPEKQRKAAGSQPKQQENEPKIKQKVRKFGFKSDDPWSYLPAIEAEEDPFSEYKEAGGEDIYDRFGKARKKPNTAEGSQISPATIDKGKGRAVSDASAISEASTIRPISIQEAPTQGAPRYPRKRVPGAWGSGGSDDVSPALSRTSNSPIRTGPVSPLLRASKPRPAARNSEPFTFQRAGPSTAKRPTSAGTSAPATAPPTFRTTADPQGSPTQITGSSGLRQRRTIIRPSNVVTGRPRPRAHPATVESESSDEAEIAPPPQTGPARRPPGKVPAAQTSPTQRQPKPAPKQPKKQRSWFSYIWPFQTTRRERPPSPPPPPPLPPPPAQKSSWLPWPFGKKPARKATRPLPPKHTWAELLIPRFWRSHLWNVVAGPADPEIRVSTPRATDRPFDLLVQLEYRCGHIIPHRVTHDPAGSTGRQYHYVSPKTPTFPWPPTPWPKERSEEINRLAKEDHLREVKARSRRDCPNCLHWYRNFNYMFHLCVGMIVIFMTVLFLFPFPYTDSSREISIRPLTLNLGELGWFPRHMISLNPLDHFRLPSRMGGWNGEWDKYGYYGYLWGDYGPPTQGGQFEMDRWGVGTPKLGTTIVQGGEAERERAKVLERKIQEMEKGVQREKRELERKWEGNLGTAKGKYQSGVKKLESNIAEQNEEIKRLRKLLYGEVEEPVEEVKTWWRGLKDRIPVGLADRIPVSGSQSKY